MILNIGLIQVKEECHIYRMQMNNENFKNSTLLVDFQYFGNISYYKWLLNSTNIILDQYENFQKMSFHNRCTISGANGVINLSVPVEGGRTQKTIFKEVRISNSENWQRDHWRSILSSYNRSPWFEYYHDELAELYKTPSTLLMDWDLACLKWSFKCLKADIRISYPEVYKNQYEEKEIVDIRGKITPRDPGYSVDKNDQKEIVYKQVFEDRTGFIPNLSILDLLFCEGGKRARAILSDT